MSEWGGRRDGAGRPRGSRNAHTKARREAAKQIVQQFQINHPDAFPGDAVSLMQCIYRDASLPLEIRLDAASKAARFERPALAAVMTNDASRVTSPRVMLVPTKSIPDYSSKVSPMTAIEAIEDLSEGDS
jgi:hypothetical protein